MRHQLAKDFSIMQQESSYGPPKFSEGNQMDDMWSLMAEFLNSNDAGNANRGPPALSRNAAISVEHNARTMRGDMILDRNSAIGHLASHHSFHESHSMLPGNTSSLQPFDPRACEDTTRPALLLPISGTRTMDPCEPDCFTMNSAHPLLWDADAEWDGQSQFGLPHNYHLPEEAIDVTLEWNRANSSSELPYGSRQGGSPGLSFLPPQQTSRKSVSAPLDSGFDRPGPSRDTSSVRAGVATPSLRLRRRIPDLPLAPSRNAFNVGMRGGVGLHASGPKTNIKRDVECPVQLGGDRMGFGGPHKSLRATEMQRSPTESQGAGMVRDEPPDVGSGGSVSIDVQLESDQDEDDPGSRIVWEEQGLVQGEGKQSVKPRSIAERMRRERISVRLQRLKDVMPRSEAKIDTSAMLDDAVTYIRSLQYQCKRLEAQNAVMAMQLAQSSLQSEQMHNNIL